MSSPCRACCREACRRGPCSGGCAAQMPDETGAGRMPRPADRLRRAVAVCP